MKRRIDLLLRILGLVAAVTLVPACEDDEDDDGAAPATGGGGSGGGGGAPTVQFSEASYTVGEGAGSVTLTVTRTGDASGSASVLWQAFANGTAEDADFDRNPNGQQLVWAAGDSAPKQVSIGITQDSITEGSENFTVFLGTPAGVTLGTPNSANVEIIDDEATTGGVFQFTTSLFTVQESATVVTISVRRTGGSAGAVSVEVRDTPQGAGPQDYTFPGNPVVLSWADGESGVKDFNVGLSPDNAPEGNESFQMTLTNPAGQITTAVGTPGSATVTIEDDDSVGGGGTAGNIEFSATTYTASETAGSLVITLRRTLGTQGDVSAVVSATDGSATQPADYQFSPQTVTWAAGDATDKTVTVTIQNDGLPETPAESFQLSLGSATGGATTGPAATVSIQD